MRDVFQSPIALRIGYSLLNSLWQGAAISLLAAALLWLLRRKSAATRYVVSAAAIAFFVAAPLTTFFILNYAARISPLPQTIAAIPAPIPNPLPPDAHSATPASTESPATALIPPPHRLTPNDSPAALQTKTPLNWIDTNLPYAVLLWAIGVLLLSLWHLGGWIAVQRLRVLDTRTPAPHIETLLATLATRLGIRRRVRVLESPHVEVPLLLGILKPLILLPPSLLLGLAPGQLEAILAHELAHVRRYDYLALLLQRIAETLLFYHPCIWWLSRRMRLEQEQCCDDMALTVIADRRQYAAALAAIEELRSVNSSRAVLAATGSAARELMQRIARLLHIEAPPTPRRARAAGAAILISTVLPALFAISLAATPPATLPFKIAKETTDINGPLKPDGTPDYVAALNAQFSRGVTPQNNLFVAFAEMFEPFDSIFNNDLPHYEQALASAGVRPGTDRQKWMTFIAYLESHGANTPEIAQERDEAFYNLMTTLWTPESFPEAAAYLKQQESLLDQVVTLSHRTKWWAPLIDRDGLYIQDSGLEMFSVMRPACELLCTRATLRAQTGDWAGCLSDLSAVKRMGSLLGGGNTVIDRLVGYAFYARANMTLGAIVAAGNLTPEQCADLNQWLDGIKPVQGAGDIMMSANRDNNLRAIEHIAIGGGNDLRAGLAEWEKKMAPDQRDSIKEELETEEKTMEAYESITRDGLDWNELLRQTNALFDTLATPEPASLKDIRARGKALDEQLGKWKALAENTENGNGGITLRQKANESPEQYVTRLAQAIVGRSTGNPAKAEELFHRSLMSDDQVRMLIAAAIFKAKSGAWPVAAEVLLSASFKELPLDPLSADGAGTEPLKYTLTNNGPRVYSAGDLGRDLGIGAALPTPPN